VIQKTLNITALIEEAAKQVIGIQMHGILLDCFSTKALSLVQSICIDAADSPYKTGPEV
jgi:hypothetical protein